MELADILGLDTLYSVIIALYDEFKDPKYRPHPCLSTMVRSGHLGRKTGQGFYKYKGDKPNNRILFPGFTLKKGRRKVLVNNR